MKNRIKNTRPVIQSRGQAERVLREICEITLNRNLAITAMDAEITSIKARYEAPILAHAKALDEKTELLRNWAEANPAEFNGAKSLPTVHGVLGWRTGQPTLKTLSGWTWDRILEKLKSLPALLTYVRVKEEVNKQAILGDRETLGPDTLRAIGCRVVQEEAFFIEPDLSKLETKQVA